MPEFWVKAGDTLPKIQGTCIGADGTAVTLTGGTARFNMRNKFSGSTIISLGTAVIESASGGIVSYSWGTADTANPGEFEGEFQITFADGKVESFPNGGTAKYIDIFMPGQIA